MTIATQPHILIGSKGLARCRESARLAGATGEPTYNFLVVREEDIGMSPSDIPSSPVNASSFAYVVGIDIGSQSCDFCVCKPDKSQVVKLTKFDNAQSFKQPCGRVVKRVNLCYASTHVNRVPRIA